ncbi:restriction endonuclease [Elizabethkingia anophelis]|uniref:restriction endonuclease n=1 Tax=Elizabethkingia anophelis TaxID=1117645 RepID=UPI001626E489|nr:restriction endonuclease [Elizabethkingia anophelis]MCT3674383.1 restriction endonuclease [Elizabethkingia anophelis]MCT3681868.1 restriction endonuclease [Elizabethkingia anophelis]MCT3770513.1 restriction endonuclease [Elizabethkingia anophelis]MCT3780797.1 restriction endonuclease [Elizabethkingia anophelis]MCT4213183.1 restriction endonuclease [Elizabethkingia anophelis]
MNDINNNLEWLKKMSSIYDNPMQEQMRIINKSIINVDKLYPNLEWLQKIHKVNINSSISELSKNIFPIDNYQRYFKEIENGLNQNLLKELVNKVQIHSYDFADLIKDFNEDELEEPLISEPSVKNIIIDVSYQIRDILFEIYLNNEKLYKISPREFEKVIAELLYNNGFEVELTKQTRDNGFDILALKYVDNLSPIKYLVECKRYKPDRKIGVEIIRGFKEVIQTEQANKGLIVTTSYFSADAIRKQKETPYLLDYKDKDELMNWVSEYYNKKKS